MAVERAKRKVDSLHVEMTYTYIVEETEWGVGAGVGR